MNKEELVAKLSRLQAGDEVYSKEKGWHTFYSFDPFAAYPIRCDDRDDKCSPHCYTMGGLYQIASPSDWDRNLSDVRYQARTMTTQPIEIADVKTPFVNARVGDMVWDSLERDYTEILEIRCADIFPIKTGLHNFDYDGASNVARDIYWQAPTNNPPERAPEAMTSKEFLDAAWELFRLAEKVGYRYTYNSDRDGKSFWIQHLGTASHSRATAAQDIEHFKEMLTNKAREQE